jgi:hypothetical protein
MQPKNASLVFAAYTAVLDKLRGALEPLGFQVVDGPIGVQQMENDVLMVGIGDASITRTQARAGMGGRVTETVVISLVMSTLNGDDDLAARRDRILQGLQAVDEICVPRPAVPEVLDSLEVDEDMLIAQSHEAAGAVVEVAFTLTGRILR